MEHFGKLLGFHVEEEWTPSTLKEKQRKGFLKVHLAVNVKTKQMMAVEVTDGGTGDGRMLKPLVEQAENHCRRNFY